MHSSLLLFPFLSNNVHALNKAMRNIATNASLAPCQPKWGRNFSRNLVNLFHEGLLILW